MPLDDYVTLGNSGLRVSPFCLGAMTFGEEWGWGASVADSETILDEFFARGGNFVDTANFYTRGHSEKIIGDYVGRKGSRRDRAVLATKFFCNLHPGDPNGGGAGRKSVFAAIDESLRRLQTDYIDLYWLHQWDKFTPIEETMRALDDLVTAGKVRYIGFSDTPAWVLAQAQTMATFRGWAPLIGLQVNYSLFERTVEGELLPAARNLGLGVTPWGPLQSGALSGKYTRANREVAVADRGAHVTGMFTEWHYTVIDELEHVARELDTTVASVALSWVQRQSSVTSTIIGVRRLDQLENNLAALDLELTDAQVAALDRISSPKLNFPAAFGKGSPSFAHAGATVNGESSALLPFVPTTDSDRF